MYKVELRQQDTYHNVRTIREMDLYIVSQIYYVITRYNIYLEYSNA